MVDLERNLEDIKKISSKISIIKKEGVRQSTSLDNLFFQIKEYENEIKKHFREYLRAEFKNPVLSYCYHNFHNEPEENYFSISTDIVPQVKKFIKNIKEFAGEKIFVDYSNNNFRIGEISGKCKFDGIPIGINVPVKTLYECSLETANSVWVEEHYFKTKLPILKEIFDLRICKDNVVSDEKGAKWITYDYDYSKDIINRTRKITFSIGNALIDEELKKERAVKTEKSIALPGFSGS